MCEAIVGDFVPGGGTASAVVSMFFQPAHEKRMEAWNVSVCDALLTLIERFNRLPDDLRNDQAFVDTVAHATQVAARNAHQGKREALRNAILNAGLPTAPNESRRILFLHYIDIMTPWHMRLLALFDSPPGWFAMQGRPVPDFGFGSLWRILQTAFEDAAKEADLVRLIWRDLHQCGLVNIDSLMTNMSGSGLLERRTSTVGRDFVAYITSPEQRQPQHQTGEAIPS